MERKIIEDKAFNMHPDEHPNIHNILKKHKLTYLNSQIHPVAKELVLEFYVNAYRPFSGDTVAEPELISWVRAKQIQFEWKMVKRLLKMKFREPNCEYLMQKTASRISCPYIVILDYLAL